MFWNVNIDNLSSSGLLKRATARARTTESRQIPRLPPVPGTQCCTITVQINTRLACDDCLREVQRIAWIKNFECVDCYKKRAAAHARSTELQQSIGLSPREAYGLPAVRLTKSQEAPIQMKWKGRKERWLNLLHHLLTCCKGGLISVIIHKLMFIHGNP